MAHVELVPAALDQEPVFANLLELYAHDFSEFHNVELGADGRFGYKHLSLYWSEPDRRPFLIKADGKLAGLVLVKRKSAPLRMRPSGTSGNSSSFAPTADRGSGRR